ncbi:glycoside hydrolase [Brevibacillus sp. MER 51]|uniref:glycoside hydrolase n=1 Tax=Brevibacillus sp. MER 51 TaxID=2939560 RepID=UPI00203BBE19|nr:glycoside hydrolase [Brevibacillus sp. MER 51]MCM3146377.1 glycoside hydrolase [Brevibacillus sp. MER 51]
MKQTGILLLVFVLMLQVVVGCENNLAIEQVQPKQHADFTFDVKPETFEVFVERDGVKESASEPMPARKVMNVRKGEQEIAWSYPDDQLDVSITKKEDHLQITLTSTGTESFSWPTVKGASYMVPLGEGKWIPADDSKWQSFLKEESLSFAESFSMRFFAVNKSKYALMYVVDNLFNNTVDFAVDPTIAFTFSHEFPTINRDKTYGFRLYVTDNDPVSVADVYKQYVKEQGELLTLAEKAKANPNIEKLYGAPHFYLWNKSFLSVNDVKWNALKTKLNENFIGALEKILASNGVDGKESIQQFREIQKQDYVADYQKKAILSGLNDALRSREFYNPQRFPHVDEEVKKSFGKGIDSLTESQLYDLNKRLLKSVLQDVVPPVEQWGNVDSTDLLKEMKAAGIDQAWIGLPDWTAAYMKPAFIQEANETGYLIASYDSYHSIHQEENPDWNTAIFKDKSLYENATISKKNGEKKAGFLQQGRLLNPTLSLPSVKQRMDDIMSNDVAFNSWFIDVDAAGDFNDDYSPQHTTTEAEDMKAKLARMDYIRDEKKLVIGSETGNDFASRSIAFAHGIETPVIKWADSDMRKNKQSPYYVGGYWSPAGEIPERYAKQVPIKEEYRHVYIDPAYSLPLYKLVYNNAVITSHHWEWSSLKIKGEVGTRMLKELLYNVPPLYHLDKNMWDANQSLITNYLKVWSPFHKKAVQQEMTDYRVLSEDRLVQKSVYGDDLQVIVNFSEQDFTYEGQVVKARSALIMNGNDKQTFFAPAQ